MAHAPNIITSGPTPSRFLLAANLIDRLALDRFPVVRKRTKPVNVKSRFADIRDEGVTNRGPT